MRKFKKVGIKLIALTIALIILVSPLNVLAAVIAPKIDELLHSDEYIGASDAYLANADIQADNLAVRRIQKRCILQFCVWI